MLTRGDEIELALGRLRSERATIDAAIQALEALGPGGEKPEAEFRKIRGRPKKGEMSNQHRIFEIIARGEPISKERLYAAAAKYLPSNSLCAYLSRMKVRGHIVRDEDGFRTTEEGRRFYPIERAAVARIA